LAATHSPVFLAVDDHLQVEEEHPNEGQNDGGDQSEPHGVADDVEWIRPQTRVFNAQSHVFLVKSLK